MEDEQETTHQIAKEEIVIEREWMRIEKLLAQKNNAACSMAIIEVDKLFREVLGIVSFGETVHEAVQNASDMFSNMKGLLEARKVYEDIVEVPGFTVDKKIAQQVTAVYLQAILDMLGKDHQEKSFSQRLVNDLVYFSESHPKLLRNLLLGFLVFVIGVWFLTNTVAGHWLVTLAVGFTQFVLRWIWGLILILLVILAITGISWAFFEQKRNKK